MSDLGDTFKAWHELKRSKRAEHLAAILEMFRVRGYELEQLSPYHYRVERFDFWPTTGFWRDGKTRKQGRGVYGLLAELKKRERRNG